MISKEAACSIVEGLVTRFGEQIGNYKKADFNKTQTRREDLFSQLQSEKKDSN